MDCNAIKITKFVAQTGTNPKVANEMLQNEGWNVDQAVRIYAALLSHATASLPPGPQKNVEAPFPPLGPQNNVESGRPPAGRQTSTEHDRWSKKSVGIPVSHLGSTEKIGGGAKGKRSSADGRSCCCQKHCSTRD